MQPRPFLALIAVVGAVLLSLSAAPIAAIALIPNLDTWPYRIDPYLLDNPITMYMRVNEFTPYPSKIDISALDYVNTSASDCAWGNGFGSQSFCPSGGLPQIKSFMSTRYVIEDFDPSNLTIIDSIGYKPRSLVSVWSDMYSVVVASTQKVVLALGMYGIMYDMSNSELDNLIFRLGSSSASGGVPVPVVQVQCDRAVDFVLDSTLHFPTTGLLMPPFHAQTSYPEDLVFTANSSQVGNLTLLQQSMSANTTYITWVDLAQHNPQASIAPSIGVAIFIPICIPTPPFDHWSGGVITCSVDARWIPSTIQLDSASSSVQDVAASPLELLLGLDVPQNDALALSPISISPEWAALLIPEAHYADFYSDPDHPDCEWRKIPVDMLAAYVADGLSRVGWLYSSDHIPFGFSDDVTSPQGFYDTADGSAGLKSAEIAEMLSNGSLIAFNMETFRRGYGYGMKSWTDWLAAGVLLIHGLIALTAIGMIIFEKETTTAWGSFAELFMLALNSMPPEDLKNTGAGVYRMNTWRTSVAVRATRTGGDAEKVQIVCKGDRFAENYTRPAVGKKYV